MKQLLFIVLFVFFGCNLNVCAQNYTAKNGSLLINAGDVYAVFDVEPGGEGITNSQLIFERKSVIKMVSLLKTSEKKAKKWSETAKREGVRDFYKNIYMYANGGIDVFTFLYTKDGITYGKETTRHFNLNSSFFKVDKNGECYVWIPCDLGSQEMPIDNTVQSTTSISEVGIINSQVAVSHSSTREKEIHELGLFTIYIKVEDLDQFLDHLNQLIVEMDDAENSSKKTNKLFK